LLLVLSNVLYSIQAFRSITTQWIGTDEIAFNYYASYLFLHGMNPYAGSMSQILKTSHLYPTYELNGNCECTYDYPALSFILPAAIAWFSNSYLYAAIFATMVLTVFITYTIYRKSGSGTYMLLPIAIWFAATFYLTPAPIDKYIAVSLFLVIAYIYRHRIILSGVFLGLAASTHQLSWIALPFFYIMTLKESGKKAMFKSMLITVGIFLIANIYFIAISPYRTASNILSLFFTKLQFSGPSIAQSLVAFYQVPYWYVTFITAMILASALLLFYLYTDTLRPLLALTPIVIFFISWRNLSSYTSIFIPLLIAVYYLERRDGMKDMLKDRRLIMYIVVLALSVSVIVLVYAHISYINSDPLRMVQISSGVVKNQTTGIYELRNISVKVASSANSPENVSFYIISRYPNGFTYIPGSLIPELSGGENHTYVLPIGMDRFSSNTKLYVFLLSENHTQGIELNTKQ
jgi:uncharacterized membrane protein